MIWQPESGTLLVQHNFPQQQQQFREEVQLEEVIEPNSNAPPDDEEADDERIRDESNAGSYPLQVIAAHSHPFLCVLFRNSTHIELFQLTSIGDGVLKDMEVTNKSIEEAQSTLEVIKVFEMELPAIPCDCIFTADDSHLMVLLPAPHYLLQFDVIASVASVTLQQSSESLPLVNTFNAYCLENDIAYIQTSAGADIAMLKHSLDRPFDKSTSIKTDSRKGAKRSRKF